MARTSAAGRRTCFLIIVLLLLAAVLMGYQYLFPAPKGQTAHIFVDGKEAASFPLNKDLEYRVSGLRCNRILRSLLILHTVKAETFFQIDRPVAPRIMFYHCIKSGLSPHISFCIPVFILSRSCIHTVAPLQNPVLPIVQNQNIPYELRCKDFPFFSGFRGRMSQYSLPFHDFTS